MSITIYETKRGGVLELPKTPHNQKTTANAMNNQNIFTYIIQVFGANNKDFCNKMNFL